MFELMAAVETLQVQRAAAVHTVQVVQDPIVRGLDDTPPPVQLVQSASSTCRAVQTAPVAPALAQSTDPAAAGLAPVAPVAPRRATAFPIERHVVRPLPRSRLWSFLTPSPFTRTMLERAAVVWREPLDTVDLEDIVAGKYLSEHGEIYLQRYLCQWAGENARGMQVLVSDWFFGHENRDLSNV